MKTHLEIIASAHSEGKIIKQYVGGAFSIQLPEKTVMTVYKPDGTEYRIPVTESLNSLYAYEFPRK
jgi:hypothetical protein